MQVSCWMNKGWGQATGWSQSLGFLQCFDAVGWLTGRVSDLWKPASQVPEICFWETRPTWSNSEILLGLNKKLKVVVVAASDSMFGLQDSLDSRSLGKRINFCAGYMHEQVHGNSLGYPYSICVVWARCMFLVMHVIDTTNACRATSCWWTSDQN